MLWFLYWVITILAYIVVPIYVGIKNLINYIEDKKIEKAPKKYSETTSVNYTPSQIRSLMDSIDYSNHPIGSAGYEYNKRRQKEKNK